MERPVVASYCTTFLKPEMLHVHRQVTGLKRYRTVVIARERQCADRFPFADLILLGKPRTNFARRFWLKYVRRAPPLFYRGEFRALERALSGARAALMHVYFGHTGVHLLPFIKVWDKPAVVSFHGADVMLRPGRPEYAVAMHELLRTLPLVLARSRSLMARLEALGCPKEKLRLNRTGVPAELYPQVERSLPVDGRWHLVQAARLIEKKGFRTSLRAFAGFRARFPEARFTVAGDGPMRAELEQLVADLGIGPSVRFVGFLDQQALAGLYASAHIFLHPSELTEGADQEGVPNSMLEAMATGLPVVATRHGGIPEAVRDGGEGYLVGERSPEAVCDALLRLAEAPREWARLGANAAALVREEFSRERQIERLESCYDEALEIHRAAAPRGPAGA